METRGIDSGDHGTSIEFFTTVPEATRGEPGVASVASLPPITPALVGLAAQLFGEAPRFWGRPLSSPEGTLTLDESAILRASEIRFLPIAKRGARVRLGMAEGLSDGEADARDLITQLGKANLVSQGGEVLVFLAVEQGASLSAEYFLGWAAGLGCASSSVAVYPCVKMAQTDERTLRAILAAQAEGVSCRGLWIVNPPDPGRKDRRSHELGPWRADKTSLSPPPPCPILLWQYADRYHGSSGFDCLVTNPSLDIESDLLAYLPLPPSTAETPEEPSPDPNPSPSPTPPDVEPDPVPRPLTWVGRLLASPWCWVYFVGGSLAMIGVGLIPDLRGGVAWAVDAALLGAMIVLIGVAVTGRPLGVLVNAQMRMSLSRFQMVLWTVILLSAYVTIIARRMRHPTPMDVEIDARLWALMGISTTTLLGAPMLQAKKKASNLLRKNESVEEAWFGDMFGSDDASGVSEVDLSKVQMFCLTLVAAVSYGVSLFRLIDGTAPHAITSFPELGSGFLAVLGLSHGGYLAGKLKPVTPAPEESKSPEAKAPEPLQPTEPAPTEKPVETPPVSAGTETPATAAPATVAPATAAPATAAPTAIDATPIRRHAIPPRSPDALPGSAFFAQLGDKQGEAREAAALEQLLAGNIPDFLRNFVEIKLSAGGHEGSVWVSPDVLAVGSDDDFVRMPLAPLTAQQIHDRYRTTFVTTKLADDIHAHAEVVLTYIDQSAWHHYTKDPGTGMLTNPFYLEHNRRVELARKAKDPELGRLVSTVKKDVVLSIKLNNAPSGRSLGRRSVVIYGWYRANGTPVQPESDVHVSTYADYSHGIRLVSTDMIVDGKPMSLFDVMEDKALAPLLLKAADIRSPSYPPPRRYEAAPKRAPASSSAPAPTRRAPQAAPAPGGPARQSPPAPSAHAAAGPRAPEAPALVELRRQINAGWPRRNRASDGILGDARHMAEGKSDHNDGNALDITYDPQNGPDLDALADLLITDPRVHYVIWNRRIRNRAFVAGAWRPYSGASPHTEHLHVSVHANERDDSTPWKLPGDAEATLGEEMA